MQVLDGVRLFSASNVCGFLECEQLTVYTWRASNLTSDGYAAAAAWFLFSLYRQIKSGLLSNGLAGA